MNEENKTINNNTKNEDLSSPKELDSQDSTTPSEDLEMKEFEAIEETDPTCEITDIRTELAENRLHSEGPSIQPLLVPRKGSLEEFIQEQLKEIYQKRKVELSTKMAKEILLQLGNKTYFLDSTSGKLVVSIEERKAVTKIKVSRDVLQKIFDQQINPQIALLSNKISIEGDFYGGLYFFNLLEP